MTIPFKKTMSVTAVAVALVLVSLLGLGVRQYLLFQKHEEVTSHTEKIIFQFAIIREHITEALLEKSYQRLAGVAGEMEELNGNLSKVLSSDNVADQYKLNFASSFDLSTIVLLLRKIESGPVEPELLRQLNREIRTLSERLMLFDRVLVNFAKRKLISFQNFVIGSLALVLSLIIVLLLFAQRQLLSPLMLLWHQAREIAGGKLGEINIGKKNGLVADLAAFFQQLHVSKTATEMRLVSYQEVARAVSMAQIAISRSQNRQKLFDGICRSLLENKEYCLVWIGLPEDDGKDLIPVAADGSTTMSRKECDSCMAILLTEAEEKGIEFNPAVKALLSAEPVVQKDILAGIPKGLLKGSPLAEGHAVCAAIPMQREGKIYAVVSIYAIGQNAFSDRDIELLEVMAGEAGLALSALDKQADDRRDKELCSRLIEAIEAFVVYLDIDGTIVDTNEIFEQMIGVPRADLMRKKWRSVLSPADMDMIEGRKDAEILLQLSSQKAVDMIAHSPVSTKRISCSIIPILNEEETVGRYGCIGREVVFDKADENSFSGVQSSRLAMLGELSTGVAHEISDLNNGIINYAQILFDNIRYQGHGQDEDNDRILDRIIEGGERVAALVRPLILYGQEGEGVNEFLPLTTVLNDTITLAGYYFGSEGISLQLELADNLPDIPVRARQMQKVFFDLLYNGRCALNKRFEGKDAGKKLIISGRVKSEGNRQCLEVSFVDYGCGMAAGEVERLLSSSSPFKDDGGVVKQGLSATLKIVENHGGTLEMTSKPSEYTRAVLSFPVS